jgi:hypothetical protein
LRDFVEVVVVTGLEVTGQVTDQEGEEDTGEAQTIGEA